jgi:hypothetical protein
MNKNIVFGSSHAHWYDSGNQQWRFYADKLITKYTHYE